MFLVKRWRTQEVSVSNGGYPKVVICKKTNVSYPRDGCKETPYDAQVSKCPVRIVERESLEREISYIQYDRECTCRNSTIWLFIGVLCTWQDRQSFDTCMAVINLSEGRFPLIVLFGSRDGSLGLKYSLERGPSLPQVTWAHWPLGNLERGSSLPRITWGLLAPRNLERGFTPSSYLCLIGPWANSSEILHSLEIGQARGRGGHFGNFRKTHGIKSGLFHIFHVGLMFGPIKPQWAPKHSKALWQHGKPSVGPTHLESCASLAGTFSHISTPISME